MRIAHFGTFDVRNYGDLLFPLVVRERLAGLAEEIVLFSPVGGQPYSDVASSLPLNAVGDAGRFDGVVVGGGNILHARATTLPDYASVATTAYANLWRSASALARTQDIPLVFNAPGVPRPMSVLVRRSLSALLLECSYASVRDVRSLQLLGLDAERHVGVNVVPDSALEVERLGIGSHPTPTLEERREPYFVVHVNERYGGSKESVETAAAIESLSAAVGCQPVFLAIGQCHGDGEIARRLGRLLGAAVVDAPTTVTEQAELIAGAQAYVGSSLHGYITAISHDTPAMIVADSSAQHKFAGLLSHVNSSSSLVPTWQTAALRFASTACDHTSVDISDALERLELHWDRLRSALEGGPRSLRRLPSPAALSLADSLAYGWRAPVSRRFHSVVRAFGPTRSGSEPAS